jgi:RNA polymerase sigma-70 factor (ECF subfamily)
MGVIKVLGRAFRRSSTVAATEPEGAALDAAHRRPDFRAVFDAESSYVWNTLVRLGVQSRDLEDVAHEVFIAVHRHLAEYDPRRPLRPWLFGITLRTAMRYRALARHRREVIESELDAIDPGPAADEQLDRAQERAVVNEALAALDLDLRTTFVMFEVDGHNAPEIAQVLGIPVNTVYSRLRRGRERFRAAASQIRARRKMA